MTDFGQPEYSSRMLVIDGDAFAYDTTTGRVLRTDEEMRARLQELMDERADDIDRAHYMEGEGDA